MTARAVLAHLPTPVEPLDRFSDWLAASTPTGHAPTVLIKRDDQTGLALGGNKARKLELLCGEALARDADVLVTGGGTQSNHVRMTAAAANRLGLACELAIAGSSGASDPPTGNLLLDRLLGARLHFTGERGYYAAEAAIAELAARLENEGRRPYAIPIGGASVTGVVAYAEAAAELLGQIDAPDWVVVADGSGGTHAGLLAGLPATVRIVGVDVGTRPDLDARIPELAAGAARATRRPAPAGEVVVDHGRYGSGYGRPTAECLEAIRILARTEGVFLDPVYTGKAMAGLIGWAREGGFASNDTVLFWHTGGSPALFAEPYGAWLTGD